MNRRGWLVIVCTLVLCGYTCKHCHEYEPVAGYTWKTVKPAEALVDDYAAPSNCDANKTPVWYYSRIGGDRGCVLSGGATVTFPGGKAVSSAPVGGWAGVYTSLRGRMVDKNQTLNPSAVLGPYVVSQKQARIVGVAVDLLGGSGRFKIELKGANDTVLHAKTFTLKGGTQTVTFNVSPTKLLKSLVWLVENGGSATVNKVRLLLRGPTPQYTVPEATFLYAYGALSQSYDPLYGMVGDRASWPATHFAAVQTTGIFALTTAVASDLGYVTKTQAKQIVSKIVTALLALPTYKGLWPHFVKYDSTRKSWDIVKDTEYSSVDTSIALAASISACAGLGLTTLQTSLESQLKAIDWATLTQNGTTCIGHGYKYDKTRLSTTWNIFGGETHLVESMRCAATGKKPACPLGKKRNPPTWDGSGFNDEIASLFYGQHCDDCWCSCWTGHRHDAASKQLSWFPSGTSHRYFGLSASEVPEPWNTTPSYGAWGVGGQNGTPNSGKQVAGCDVVAPHYAALIMAENPKASEEMFYELMVKDRLLTPLNGVEALCFKSGQLRVSMLKGSWNLSLMALGAARAIQGSNYSTHNWFNKSALLARGLKSTTTPTATCP